MARLGGKARAAKLKPKRRTEIARTAALARWAKKRKGGLAIKNGTGRRA
jgi:hypothetical protein